ncbi:MAG: ankyrin repeat domain-containing protein [Rickettsiales bacterium]|jgi:hypothetical protein|nr:ankyrin repeat domain-containing protein [Rickettsiales bacterium]
MNSLNFVPVVFLMITFGAGITLSDNPQSPEGDKKIFKEFKKKIYENESLREGLSDEDFEPLLENDVSIEVSEKKNTKGATITDRKNIEAGGIGSAKKDAAAKSGAVNDLKAQGNKNIPSAKTEIGKTGEQESKAEVKKKKKVEKEKIRKKEEKVKNTVKIGEAGTKEAKNVAKKVETVAEIKEQETKIEEKKKKRKKKKDKAEENETKNTTVIAVGVETSDVRPGNAENMENKTEKAIATVEINGMTEAEIVEAERILAEDMGSAVVSKKEEETEIEPKTDESEQEAKKLKIKTKAEKLKEKQKMDQSKEEKVEANGKEKIEIGTKGENSSMMDKMAETETGSTSTTKQKNSENSENTSKKSDTGSGTAETAAMETGTENADTKIPKDGGKKTTAASTGTSRRNSTDVKVFGDELKNMADKIKQLKDAKSGLATADDKKLPMAEKEPAGVLEKVYSYITDTGVSEEFLYSKEYSDLLDASSKVELKKTSTNSEKDIPLLYSVNKGIISFRTSDIPEELLDYRRTEVNSHIPTIFKSEDLKEMAKKAILQSDLSALRGIMEETRDPDFLVDEDKTLLLFSVESNSYLLTRYLIYSGASINESNSDMDSPLHRAANIGNVEMVKLLIENGANINAQNVLGETPLMIAIVKNHEGVIYTLLKNGADLDIKNISGETVYTLCLKHNRKKVQQYLVNVLRAEATKK